MPFHLGYFSFVFSPLLNRPSSTPFLFSVFLLCARRKWKSKGLFPATLVAISLVRHLFGHYFVTLVNPSAIRMQRNWSYEFCMRCIVVRKKKKKKRKEWKIYRFEEKERRQRERTRIETVRNVSRGKLIASGSKWFEVCLRLPSSLSRPLWKNVAEKGVKSLKENETRQKLSQFAKWPGSERLLFQWPRVFAIN